MDDFLTERSLSQTPSISSSASSDAKVYGTVTLYKLLLTYVYIEAVL